MNFKTKSADSCIFIIFGATGDLMRRKLISGFFNLHRKKLLPKNFAIVGIGRREYDNEIFRHEMCVALGNYVHEDLFDKIIWKKLRKKLFYFKMNFEEETGYAKLNKYLSKLDKKIGADGNKIFYLSTKPSQFSTITQNIKKNGLIDRTKSSNIRVVIEKPFGKNLRTAKKLNRVIRNAFREEEIYRIDHYLAKETVQNILVLRFANGLFEPLWNQKYISNVQITSSETLGVSTRGNYYDQYGALRDMVQNHLLQLLTLIAMEPPLSFDPDEIKEEKVKVLRSIKRYTEKEVKENVVRAQYLKDPKCDFKSEECKKYINEKGIDKKSRTETFVALKLNLMNWRWSGVPFYLRTGKRMKANATEIIINFKALPIKLFANVPSLERNVLIIRIQPDEGIHLQFNAKKPGNKMNIEPVHMDFCSKSIFGTNTPEAYERLLYDVMSGESTLFSRWDEVEQAWRVVDPITKAWNNNNGDLYYYKCGSWGPKQKDKLVRKLDHEWFTPISKSICRTN